MGGPESTWGAAAQLLVRIPDTSHDFSLQRSDVTSCELSDEAQVLQAQTRASLH